MNEPQEFRSAFNGFNREDVVNHISYMTNKYELQVNQLRSEADALRTERDELQERLDGHELAQDRVPELEAELADTLDALAKKDAELAQKETDLAEKDARIAQLEAELEEAQLNAAKPKGKNVKPVQWDELQAYRRAENAERRARERVNFLYDKANEAIDLADEYLGITTKNIDELTEKLRVDLVALQDAVEAGRDAMRQTVDTVNSLRPEVDDCDE